MAVEPSITTLERKKIFRNHAGNQRPCSRAAMRSSSVIGLFSPSTVPVVVVVVIGDDDDSGVEDVNDEEDVVVGILVISDDDSGDFGGCSVVEKILLFGLLSRKTVGATTRLLNANILCV